MQDVTIKICEIPTRAFTIDDLIESVERHPERWGGLLQDHEAAVVARGPVVVAARVAEGKRFLASLTAAQAERMAAAARAARLAT